MNGILNINKPRGITSYGVVAQVKRLLGERRVGHAGTLDPEADGVLPVCIGRATRVIEFLAEAAKTYRAEIELGIVTSTYDAAGAIIETRDASAITGEQVESALASFLGVIAQKPPVYSAVKLRGKPLYKWARSGVAVEPMTRQAAVYSIKLLSWQNPILVIEVACGKGTYIRSLAHDLGQRLNCGAYLKSLTRLRYGVFDIREAISLARFEAAAESGYWGYFAYPPDTVLLGWSAMVLGEESCRLIANGRPLNRPEIAPPPGNRCRAYTADGCLLAILRFNPELGEWHPDKVLI